MWGGCFCWGCCGILWIMNKRTTKTSRKTAVRVATKKRSVTKKHLGPYAYDTELGVLADDYKIPIGKFSPTMKLGDFFESIGEDSLARILKGL